MPSKIRTLRRIAFDRQHGHCWYCGVQMWLESPAELARASPRAATRLQCTAEHLLARSEGGRDAVDNVVAACAHCNRTRHKRKNPPDPAAYRAEIARRVGRGKWHPAWVTALGLISGISSLSSVVCSGRYRADLPDASAAEASPLDLRARFEAWPS